MLRHQLRPRARDARAGVVAGELMERQPHRRRAARKAFPKAWKRLRRAGERAWA